MKQFFVFSFFKLLGVFIISGFLACEQANEPAQSKAPNILWLSCEDISPLLASYGDSTANTHVLDKLASESMLFTNVYATVGVCAPARSSLITGMYPTSIGTSQMRTGQDIAGWGKRDYSANTNAKDINGDSLRLYSAVTPSYVKCFTEYLREAGYYCTNNAKTDYQFAAPLSAWDENGGKAHWKNTPEGMPFFSVFNHEVTHESRIWMNKDLPLTVNPDSVPLPAYYPETDIVKTDVARVYSNIELLDKQIGEKLKELEEANLLENTIVFFFSDHGGPLPRGKREHYNSGLKVPFMVRFPNGEHADTYNELVSFVDVAPTVLSLAGIQPPEYMQGKAFLGSYKAEESRKYVFGAGDRFDEYPDRIRSVSDGKFMYVRNYHPELPHYKDVAYRKNVPMMNEMLSLYQAGSLLPKQQIWFNKTKPIEEFYNCETDPYQVNNIISEPSLESEIELFRKELKNWEKQYGDLGSIPESQLIEQMWPGGVQPITNNPTIEVVNNSVVLSCETQGSSLNYIVANEKTTPNLDSGWKLYTKPIEIRQGQILYVIANRIGYADSEIIEKVL